MADYAVPGSVSTVNGQGNYAHVQPGDRLLVPAGTRGLLRLVNLTGLDGLPVTLINDGGKVTIQDGDWLCISLENSQHVKVSGTGDPSVPYGFDLTGYTNAGWFMWKGSSAVELDHVEIHDPVGTGGAGIRAYTDRNIMPAGWVQVGPHVHHCHIYRTNTEAMYLGQFPDTNGTPIHDLWVYNCLLEDVGWEGIQVRYAESSCRVYGNDLRRIGWNDTGSVAYTGAGLDVQDATGGYWAYNRVEGCVHGMWLNDHQEGIQIEHNLLLDCAEDGLHWGGWNGAFVVRNTVVRSGGTGIDVTDKATGGEVRDNLIVECETGLDVVNVPQHHNLVLGTVAEARFLNPGSGDFHILADSPAVHAGSDGGYAGAFGDP